MKNKKPIQERLELIDQLLGAVNSKEEFAYLQAEQSRLFFSNIVERRLWK